jgi:hypothetical protein
MFCPTLHSGLTKARRFGGEYRALNGDTVGNSARGETPKAVGRAGKSRNEENRKFERYPVHVLAPKTGRAALERDYHVVGRLRCPPVQNTDRIERGHSG